MERMEGLTNRLRRLIHEDLNKAGQSKDLGLIHVLESILLQSTWRDMRNETLMRYLDAKDLIDKDLFARMLCDIVEEHVDKYEYELGIHVDENGKFVRQRIH